MQFMKGSGEKSHFFPQVHEEIILVNVETKTILNYMSIIDFPSLSLISMLSGPQAMFAGEFRDTNAILEEEGFRS